MPCWYFERKEIKNSASFKDGVDSATENRYRREGGKFIMDAGTRLGLRYDTCATGIVYFHRFYMFHSFKEFYRYVTAACCLLLAGKVEETPKKCKDIIKTSQNLLSPASFLRFGEDPREEVMMMERVLLKTIKFDLQLEHPYGYMLKYAKMFKGDREKTQKMAQMAWTFINDSLYTTLCLQWEPEIIAVSLMYLASRLTKFEPTDWSGRQSSKTKWWEDLVEGMTMELMEDICHQVLDLYSNKQKKGFGVDSPPHSPAKVARAQDSPPPPPPPERPHSKRGREQKDQEVPVETESGTLKPVKHEKEMKPPVSAPSQTVPASSSVGAPIPVAKHITSQPTSHSSYPGPELGVTDYSSYNPYVSSQMYSASFMSQEGLQNIQSILAGSGPQPPPAISTSTYPEPHHHSSHHHHPPQSSTTDTPSSQYHPPPLMQTDTQYPYPPPPTYGPPPPTLPPPHSYAPSPTRGAPSFDPYAAPPNPSPYPAPSYASPLPQPSAPTPYTPPAIPPPQSYGGYSYPPSSHAPPTNVPPPHLPPPPSRGGPVYPPPSSSFPPNMPGGNNPQNFGGPSHHGGREGYQKHGKHPMGGQRKDIPALTEIKITGRMEWGMPK